jgi:ATP-dependent Clp endopeptidase proteolytic subunit ClpP
MSWIELVAQRRSPTAPPGLKPPENAADWYTISNSATEPDATDVYVYNDIGGWFGLYADDFIGDFSKITSKNINLRLNSPGGSVFEGIAIANTIRAHPSNVTVYVDGLAASIASIIALAGDKLVMMPQSQFMIHDASGMCYGNASDMEDMVKLLNKQSQNIAEAYADRAGGTVDEWRALMKAETWYTAKEAVAAGLADAVGTSQQPSEDEPDQDDAPTVAPSPKQKMRNVSSWDLAAMFRYAGREKAPTPKNISNVMRQFDEGDRVAAIVKHEPEHTVGRIAVVNGNAYGIIWDQPDDDTAENNTDVYRWYTDDELQFVAEGEDGGGEDGYDEGGEPTKEEPLLPGISHPGGIPLAPHADAEPLTIKVGDVITKDVLEALVRQTIQAELAVVEGTACPSHSTAVKAGAWDAGANEGHLPSPVPLATVKKMYAYYDEDQVEDGAAPKSACKLPHHFVSSDGTPGAASINGVRNALARLPQTQGLSAQEKAAAEAHLRKHLNAFSGGSEEEDHVHEELEAHEHEHFHDASKKSKPAPDEDEDEPGQDEEPDESGDDEPDGDDDNDGGSKKSTKASADDWPSVVAFLTDSPSPSADDVFKSLKEAW